MAGVAPGMKVMKKNMNAGRKSEKRCAEGGTGPHAVSRINARAKKPRSYFKDAEKK